ncbi:MAG: hypothetical protein HC898_02990 [Phycisphaerales bacterium]|nr:hypothetical protein [Phycisphaerales bacterium]
MPLKVDWNRNLAPLTLMHWGVADYDITMPERAKDPQFNAYLKLLKPEFIRIHHAGLSDRWTDATTRKWDVAKLKEVFASTASGYGDARIMLNIANWPKWFHDGDVLPSEKRLNLQHSAGNLHAS